jgi:hypothetical protein
MLNINEAILFYDSDFNTFLRKIYEGPNCLEKEAAGILWNNTHKQYKPLVGTEIKLLKSGEVQYNRVIQTNSGEAFKLQKAGLQRFLTQLFKDIGRPQNQNIIDALSRRLKSFVLVDEVQVKLVVGSAIPWCYLSDNTLETGSLNTSCMRYDSKQDFLELYKINPDRIALLVVFQKDLVVARKLIWRTNSNKITYDTTYYAAAEYITIIYQYIEDLEKRKTLLEPTELTNSIMTEKEITVLNTWKTWLDKEWYAADDSSSYDNIDLTNIPQYMPYLDTYHYVDISQGMITLSKDYADYKATSQNGYITSDCQSCDGTGKHECTECEGRGTKECEDCYNGSMCEICADGKIDCPNCEETGKDSNCDLCKGKTEITCPECDGDFECQTCDAAGYIDCSECWGRGSLTCSDCNNGTVLEYIGDII